MILVLSPLDVLASVSFKNNTALLQSNSLSLSAHSEENRSQISCMLLSRNHRDLAVEEVCNCKWQNPHAISSHAISISIPKRSSWSIKEEMR